MNHHRVGHPTPRHPGRLPVDHQPSHEGVKLHDAKMAAYCQEVRWLEDKFDGLELNHIPRRLNEAADALARAASGREPVLTGVFASDQCKPSVRYEGSERADDGPSDLAPRADQL